MTMWSPFQSSEVREICANLTPDERTRLVQNAYQRGMHVACWICIPFGLATALLLALWHPGWQLQTLAILGLYIVFYVFFELLRGPALRRRTRELLCETQWARAQGYTPDGLRLMSLPWSR
jgi:hypothetical protein